MKPLIVFMSGHPCDPNGFNTSEELKEFLNRATNPREWTVYIRMDDVWGSNLGRTAERSEKS